MVRKGSYHIKIKELHNKYGPVVRIGPNTLDFDFPELIKTLYGTDGKWKKVSLVPQVNSQMLTPLDRILSQQQCRRQWQDHLSSLQYH